MTEPFVHLSPGFNFLLLVIIIIIINTSIVIVMIVIINIIAKKGRYCGGLSKHIFPNQLKAWLFRILSATLIKTWLPRLKIEKRQKLFSNRPNWPPLPPYCPSSPFSRINFDWNNSSLTQFAAALYCNWETINDNYANQNLHFEDIFLLPVNSGPLILRPSATLFGI